jgi:hypothetical protein
MTGVHNWRTSIEWPKRFDMNDMEAIEYKFENDNGETENDFQEENALAALLLSGAVFLNSNWWEKEWPEDARKTVALCVNTNDVFAWGCADAESMMHDEIEEVFNYWNKDQHEGTAVWAMIKTKQMPQRPVEKAIRDAGIWDLDELKEKHNLRANYYDGIGGVLAQLKRRAYIKWCEENGKEALPYDGHWWDGWREYVAEHPDWYSEEWKAEEKRLMEEWKLANGWL